MKSERDLISKIKGAPREEDEVGEVGRGMLGWPCFRLNYKEMVSACLDL